MAGPETRANITVDRDPDGRIVHTFRQSTLGELDICAERGRFTMTGEMPSVETDAANLGTAVHAGIEEGLRDLMNGDQPSLSVCQEIAMLEFSDMIEHPDFRWVKYHPNGKAARKFITSALDLWFTDVLPDMKPTHVELPFGPLVLHEDEHRVIQVTGTIDVVDAAMGAGDWKTAGDSRKYQGGFGGKAWEIERWAIQPTVYTWALVKMGILPQRGPWPFTFWAFHMDGDEAGLNKLEVERHRGDHDWLVDKCMSIVPLVEAEVTPWPRSDNHALCSEKWCPAWSQCKGDNYDVGWPKPSKPQPRITVGPDDPFEGL